MSGSYIFACVDICRLERMKSSSWITSSFLLSGEAASSWLSAELPSPMQSDGYQQGTWPWFCLLPLSLFFIAGVECVEHVLPMFIKGSCRSPIPCHSAKASALGELGFLNHPQCVTLWVTNFTLWWAGIRPRDSPALCPLFPADHHNPVLDDLLWKTNGWPWLWEYSLWREMHTQTKYVRNHHEAL